MAPGSSCSGRGRLTHNQRARKPPGKCALEEESLLPMIVDPEQLCWLSQCRTLQKATGQAGFKGSVGTERRTRKQMGFSDAMFLLSFHYRGGLNLIGFCWFVCLVNFVSGVGGRGGGIKPKVLATAPIPQFSLENYKEPFKGFLIHLFLFVCFVVGCCYWFGVVFLLFCLVLSCCQEPSGNHSTIAVTMGWLNSCMMILRMKFRNHASNWREERNVPTWVISRIAYLNLNIRIFFYLHPKRHRNIQNVF